MKKFKKSLNALAEFYSSSAKCEKCGKRCFISVVHNLVVRIKDGAFYFCVRLVYKFRASRDIQLSEGCPDCRICKHIDIFNFIIFFIFHSKKTTVSKNTVQQTLYTITAQKTISVWNTDKSTITTWI